MRAKLTVAVLGVGLLLAAVPLVAHHSFAAEYDAQKPVKFTGTVTQMEWITVITVEGYQAKDGALRANGRDITYQDGRKLFVGSSGIGAPDERPEK
jgi:hypothetical protein